MPGAVVAADPLGIVLALATLLVAWAASSLFSPLLNGMANRIPLVGWRIGAWVQAVLADTAAAIGGWVDGAVGPLTDVLTRSAQVPGNLWAQAARALGLVAAAVQAMPGQIQAWAQANIYAPLDGALKWWEGFASQNIAALQAAVPAGVQAAEAHADQAAAGALQQAEAFAQHVAAGAGAQLGSEVAGLSAQVAALVAGMEDLQRQVGSISQAVAAAEGEVQALGNGAIPQALRQAEGYAAGQVQGLAAQLGPAIAGAAAAGGAAGVLAQAVRTALSTYLESCGDPLCSGVMPQLQALQQLQGTADVGGLLVLLGAAAGDPAGLAAAVDAAWAGPVGQVAGMVRGMLGGG